MTIGSFSIICDSENRVLLCRRRDIDLWNLPGGRAESGESPWEAAVREAKEELGVTISVRKLIGIFCKSTQNDLVFQFVADVVAGTPTLSDEVCEYGYFSEDSLPENTAPRQKERISLYFQNPDVLHMREQ